MKRRITLVAAVILTFALILTGCLSSNKPVTPEQPATEAVATTEAVAAPVVVAADAKIIKISMGLNEKHPQYLGLKKFEELLEAETQGRFDIQIYPNAALGDDVKAVQDTKMGTLEMVSCSTSPLTGLASEFMVFDLPFMIPSSEVADQVLDGPVGKKIGDSLDAKGLHLLTYYENGYRQLTNSEREVRTPADLAGLKIRTMENPIHLAAWKALGANPTPMPFSEVFTAMQQETIDGQENPIATIYLQKFFEVQKFVTLTGHVYSPHLVLINADLWKSLSAEDQAIFEKAAKESATYNRQQNREMNASMITDLEAAGMTVTKLTADELKAFQDATAPVIAEFEEKIGKDIVAEFKAAVEAAK